MSMQHVEGENKGDVVLYALSTCGWCKKDSDDVGGTGSGIQLRLC